MFFNKRKLNYYFLRICAIFFLGFYLFATLLYPGGSGKNTNSKGFDWLNNYWCDLMGNYAINSELNPAKNYAIIALLFLCAACFSFFIDFANTFVSNQKNKVVLKASSTISVLFATFIFTSLHDFFILLSCLFGLIAVVIISVEVSRSNLWTYKLTGLFCIFLLCLTNFIYYGDIFLSILPVLQKITLVFTLSWMVGLNRTLNRVKKRY